MRGHRFTAGGRGCVPGGGHRFPRGGHRFPERGNAYFFRDDRVRQRCVLGVFGELGGQDQTSVTQPVDRVFELPLRPRENARQAAQAVVRPVPPLVVVMLVGRVFLAPRPERIEEDRLTVAADFLIP